MGTIKKYSAIVIAFVALFFAGFSWWKSSANGKIAFVQMDELYNSFAMKQQLETKLKNTQQARKFIVDSLALEMQQMQQEFSRLTKIDSADLRVYNTRQHYFYQQKQQFEEDNQTLAKQYTDQIWGQINQYTNDFGKANGYQYIFGAAGDGVLMYASDAQDITVAVKEYINERYSGQSK